MSLALLKRNKSERKAQMVLRDLKRKHGTWRAVSEWISKPGQKPINTGMLYQVAEGKRSAPNSILQALRLPLKTLPAPVCSQCGHVHTTKRCTQHKQTAKPRRIWQRCAMDVLKIIYGERLQSKGR